ncbi:MAG: hypothetical protein AB8B56_05350 [Crocinitomicaceae bacterium]
MSKPLFLGCLFSLICLTFVSCTKENNEPASRPIEEVKMLIQNDIRTAEYEYQKERLSTELMKNENITSAENRQTILQASRDLFRDYYQSLKATYPEIETISSEQKAELFSNMSLTEMKEKAKDLEIAMMTKNLSAVEIDCDELYDQVDDLWDTADALYQAGADGMSDFIYDLADAAADLYIYHCL